MKEKNLVNRLILIYIPIVFGIISCFILSNKRNTYAFIVFTALYAALAILLINKFNIEKSIVLLFVLFIPFMTELNINYKEDIHIVSKSYFAFNYLYLFCIYFIVKISQEYRKINIGFDLLFLLIFNIICIISGLNALNFKAFFFDYIRYFTLSIVYIYFSRVFEFKKYKDTIYKYLVLGLLIQLVLGLLQKVKGSALGLVILGEGFDIFRASVSGYEKGFSGTFGHPGPMALYANYLLAILLFNKNIKPKIRISGVILSSIIIIVAAGRTSILIMFLIFAIYILNDLIKLNAQSILVSMGIVSGGVVSFIMFFERIKPLISRFTDSDISFQYNNRMKHIVLGMEYIKENPLLGLGLNNYLDNTYNDYPFQFSTNFYLSNPIHNAFILYGVEIGLIGLIVFALFLINNVIMYNKINKKINIEERNVLKGSLTVLIIWCVYALQGWGGVQTRSLLILLLSSSIIYSIYNNYKVAK